MRQYASFFHFHYAAISSISFEATLRLLHWLLHAVSIFQISGQPLFSFHYSLFHWFSTLVDIVSLITAFTIIIDIVHYCHYIIAIGLPLFSFDYCHIAIHYYYAIISIILPLIDCHYYCFSFSAMSFLSFRFRLRHEPPVYWFLMFSHCLAG